MVLKNLSVSAEFWRAWVAKYVEVKWRLVLYGEHVRIISIKVLIMASFSHLAVV